VYICVCVCVCARCRRCKSALAKVAVATRAAANAAAHCVIKTSEMTLLIAHGKCEFSNRINVTCAHTDRNNTQEQAQYRNGIL